ncbi:hypothetical protein BD626DRAFT_566288 [Schizophyllum amplum]|uniref:Uncharacterized protein n=1 Tax=Schizophyllum amplum TaxID=97359 RepID=A0A550CRB5_9AGAR|nr:hypothetical protein BD626DRAFT_566288 [Auriculariopsis ampla]
MSNAGAPVHAMLASMERQIQRLEAELLKARNKNSDLDNLMLTLIEHNQNLEDGVEALETDRDGKIEEIKVINRALRAKEEKLVAIVRRWRERPSDLAKCDSCGGVASIRALPCHHNLCESLACCGAPCNNCWSNVKMSVRYEPIPTSYAALKTLGNMSRALMEGDSTIGELGPESDV